MVWRVRTGGGRKVLAHASDGGGGATSKPQMERKGKWAAGASRTARVGRGSTEDIAREGEGVNPRSIQQNCAQERPHKGGGSKSSAQRSNRARKDVSRDRVGGKLGGSQGAQGREKQEGSERRRRATLRWRGGIGRMRKTGGDAEERDRLLRVMMEAELDILQWKGGIW